MPDTTPTVPLTPTGRPPVAPEVAKPSGYDVLDWLEQAGGDEDLARLREAQLLEASDNGPAPGDGVADQDPAPHGQADTTGERS